MSDPTQALLLYFIIPLWFLAGFADWLCHRATDIEHTTGVKESLLHLLMFTEIAVPLLACLFLEVNAAIFLLMILAFSGWVDAGMAGAGRISPCDSVRSSVRARACQSSLRS